METKKAEKIARWLDFSSKLLLIIFIVFFIIFVIFNSIAGGYIDLLLRHPFSCFGFDFTTFFLSRIFWYLFVVLPVGAVVFGLATHLFINIEKVKLTTPALGINFLRVCIVVIVIFIFLGLSLVSMCGCGANFKARDARRMSDLRQIKAAQDLYHQKYSRYADTQQDLVNDGILSLVITDPATGEQYTDADGSGIKGGDNDLQTWSVKAYLENSRSFTREICDHSNSKQIPRAYYFCNEKGCEVVSQ